MIYDETFPVYAAHIRKITAAAAVIAAAAAAVCFGLSYGAGVVLGALFQIAFLSFLRAKYIKWSEAGRKPEDIGHRLVFYTGARLFFEIGACVLVTLAAGLAVFGFLAGLLSLTAATIVDKVVSVIKE